MCYSTFHRCVCVVYKLQPWLDCIFCEAHLLAEFFKRIQLHKDLKNRFVGLCQKDIASFIWKINPPILLESNKK